MIQITKGNAYQIGVTVLTDLSVNITVELNSSDCGLILYSKNSDEVIKIPFEEKYQIGDVYCLNVSGFNPYDYDYNFYDGNLEVVDCYAKVLKGNEDYGEIANNLRGSFYSTKFNWEDDKCLETAFCNSLLYIIHPRGFTKDKSANTKHSGCFQGIVEKISYLKEMGVTAIILTPSYEFIEKESVSLRNQRIPMAYQEKEPKLNYWGYKKGFYFAPKSAYSDSETEVSVAFKEMVKTLHKNGIEVIMQFFFKKGESKVKILDVLHFWVLEYHVDGFQLLGENIPLTVIGTDPLLRKTKLIHYNFPVDEIYCKHNPKFLNLAECNNVYSYDMRRFLKSDERTIEAAINHMRYQPKKIACIHYITEVNGFTLADLVSFDRKHNELNGENNMDGNPYNASWNCGAEGVTRKKSIQNLRLKQMKNAFALSLLSQSTPMILMGDEFANSQKGNNNPYCIDNELTWLNWNDAEKNKELLSFVKRLIHFRFEHDILHKETECSLLDENESGYPELSFHGDEAWKCNTDHLSRHFAMMYHYKNEFMYIAINMHWVNHDFALPKLPKGLKWERVFDTAVLEEKQGKVLKSSKKLNVTERSIQILLAD